MLAVCMLRPPPLPPQGAQISLSSSSPHPHHTEHPLETSVAPERRFLRLPLLCAGMVAELWGGLTSLLVCKQEPPSTLGPWPVSTLSPPKTHHPLAYMWPGTPQTFGFAAAGHRPQRSTEGRAGQFGQNLHRRLCSRRTVGGVGRTWRLCVSVVPPRAVLASASRSRLLTSLEVREPVSYPLAEPAPIGGASSRGLRQNLLFLCCVALPATLTLSGSAWKSHRNGSFQSRKGLQTCFSAISAWLFLRAR